MVDIGQKEIILYRVPSGLRRFRLSRDPERNHQNVY